MTPSSFLQRFRDSWPPPEWGDVTVLAAVSGGADSVALLAALHACKAPGPGKLFAAHFNHRLRGRESDEDERFVRRLAEQLEIECVVGRADDRSTNGDAPDGIEAAAREARYAFLTEAAQRAGARYVVVAHTADDQAETVLHRILRGSGVAGLGGILRARPLAPGVTLIRPLLSFRREDTRAYLREIGQTWREDGSNANLEWTRNRIRNELLPQLARDYNPDVVNALVRLSELARETQEVIDRQAELLLETCVTSASPEEVSIDAEQLQGRPRHLVCEFFIALWRRQNWPRQRMGRDEWRRLAAMANECPAVHDPVIMLPGAVTARRRGTWLVLRLTSHD